MTVGSTSYHTLHYLEAESQTEHWNHSLKTQLKCQLWRWYSVDDMPSSRTQYMHWSKDLIWHYAPNRKGKQGLEEAVAPLTITSNNPLGDFVIHILATLGSERLRHPRFPKGCTFIRGHSKGTSKVLSYTLWAPCILGPTCKKRCQHLGRGNWL